MLLTLNGTIENLVGSPFPDTLAAGFLSGAANTRLIDGGDPSTAPGDTLTVDFQNNPGSQTLNAPGVEHFDRAGFGSISYASIETPVAANVSGLNAVVAPQIDLIELRFVAADTRTEVQRSEGLLLGSFTTAQMDQIAYTGNDAFDDHVILDLTRGDFLPINGASIAGGAGGNDQLTIFGDGALPAAYTPGATTTGDGNVDIAGRLVSFTGLEPLELVGFSQANLTPKGNDDVLNLINGTTTLGSPGILVSGTSGGVAIEPVIFRNNTTVLIDTTQNSADGNDTITINSADGAHGNTNLTVLTGSGTNSVAVNGNVSVGTLAVGGAALSLGADNLIAADGVSGGIDAGRLVQVTSMIG